MSIAIHSQKGTPHAAAVAGMSRRHETSRDAETTERSAEAKAPRGRHALMNALSDALAGLGAAAGATAEGGATAGADTTTAQTPEQKEALHAFAHELFNALRPTPDSTGKGHHGRGFAWGRTSLGDLAERIEALAQKLTGATAPAGTAPVTPTAGDAATTPAGSASTTTGGPSADTSPGAASTTAGSGTTAGTATPASTTTGAAATSGAAATTGAAATAAATATTTTTTAPSPTASTGNTPAPSSTSSATGGESSLLSAFRRLAAALQGTAPAGAAAGSPADALAALLHRMAQTLVPDAHTDAPASGSLIDVTA